MDQQRDKAIALVATLDTKGPETAYLKARIEQRGFSTLILDTGILERRNPMAPAGQFPPEMIAADEDKPIHSHVALKPTEDFKEEVYALLYSHFVSEKVKDWSGGTRIGAP